MQRHYFSCRETLLSLPLGIFLVGSSYCPGDVQLEWSWMAWGVKSV